MKKKYFILILLMMIPFMVYADNRVIEGNDFDIYKRSKEDIASKYAVGAIDESVPIYITEPSYVSPYKAGITTDAYLAELVDNLNYYRYLAGVPEIEESTTNDPELQTAEVIQTLFVETYRRLTHYLYNEFPKPDDMDQEFYDLGANANHNIISYGMPQEPVFFFFDESIFNEEDPKNGHRMALLSAEVVKEDFGVGEKTIYGRSTKNINNYNRMTNDFAAYPSPGYFPKQDFADISDWDIYLNTQKFKVLTSDQVKNVVVTFRNLRTGETEERSYQDENLRFEYSCGITNCLYLRFSILQPSREGIYYDDEYEVTVTNLIDKNNEPVDLHYTVKFYDRLEGTEVNLERAEYDLYLNTILYDGEFNQNLLDGALDGLGMTMELEGNYKYHYVPDNYIFRNYTSTYGYDYYQAFPNYNKLPDYINDVDNVLDDKYITVWGSTNPAVYNFTYNDVSYNKDSGESVTLTVDDVNWAYDGTAIYYWVKEKDGVFYDLDDESKYSTTGLTLTVNNLTAADSGNYYLTALLTSDYYYSIYYLSKPLNLTVNVSITKGDMNGNSKIDLADIIVLLKKYLNGDATEEEIVHGDMDNDGNIGLKDIIILLKSYLGAN